MINRIAKLWPIILTVTCGMAGLIAIKNKVDYQEKSIIKHARRLDKVELNATIARVNTDALVENLLTEKQKLVLRHQVDSLSSYVLKEDSGGEQ